MSNFSFSHSVFKRLVSQGRQKVSLCGNGLTLYQMTKSNFADKKLENAKMTISPCDRIENTVGKGENAGYQHFLLILQWFPKPSALGSLKVGIVYNRVNLCWPCFSLTLYYIIQLYNDPEEEGFWQNCLKRRKCWWVAFYSFPTMFATSSK